MILEGDLILRGFSLMLLLVIQRRLSSSRILSRSKIAQMPCHAKRNVSAEGTHHFLVLYPQSSFCRDEHSSKTYRTAPGPVYEADHAS
ncbi:hypothetical protein B0H21DRAFT_750662 [Amylocystis lapponica]|nr:hypothetical protein B0H21DRAFT_750662 [Amylocystis lapponica]